MSSSLNAATSSLNTGNVTENVITAKPAIVLALVPSGAANTGTCTLRDSATAVAAAARHIAPIATPLNGIKFGPYGVLYGNGITMQNSVSGDVFDLIWMPA